MSEPTRGKKPKLLFMRQMLLDNTDENHSLDTYEILDILERNGISGERKTVSDDIAVISDVCQNEFEIDICKKGKASAFKVSSRLFSVDELSMLADAVASSKFITETKSKDMIKRLATLASVYDRPSLSRNVYVANRVKTTKDTYSYTMSEIRQAIAGKKKVSFQYLSYDMSKNLKPRHNGEYYKVSPYKLMWDKDKYYLICWCDKHQTLANYRIDRMKGVSMTDEPIEPLTMSSQELEEKMSSVFEMFGGQKVRITLLIHKQLLDVIVDTFGKGVTLYDTYDENYFECSVSVELSPTFWGWLFKFSDKARILTPDYVVDMAREEISKLANIYNI